MCCVQITFLFYIATPSVDTRARVLVWPWLGYYGSRASDSITSGQIISLVFTGAYNHCRAFTNVNDWLYLVLVAEHACRGRPISTVGTLRNSLTIMVWCCLMFWCIFFMYIYLFTLVQCVSCILYSFRTYIKGTVSPCNKLISEEKSVKNYNIHENCDCIWL